MEGSPLGSAFGDSVGRSKGKKSILLIAVAAALGLGGSVLASNININSGGTVEFGQGVASTAPCDSTINVSPTSSYDEANSQFILENVVLSDVSNECNNVVFTVSVYASGNPTAQGQVVQTMAATATASPFTSATFEFTATPRVATSNAARITVETED